MDFVKRCEHEIYIRTVDQKIKSDSFPYDAEFNENITPLANKFNHELSMILYDKKKKILALAKENIVLHSYQLLIESYFKEVLKILKNITRFNREFDLTKNSSSSFSITMKEKAKKLNPKWVPEFLRK
jgi:hypothetical protein